MCGIFGCIGYGDVRQIVRDGIERNAYRGYDSFGMAVIADTKLFIEKRGGIQYEGRIGDTLNKIVEFLPNSNVAIGHARWSTHGRPSNINAHPQTDCHGVIAVCHNGIIENSYELRTQLKERGHHFVSDTDTEIIAHLAEECFKQGGDVSLESAQRMLLNVTLELKGFNAFLLISELFPETIFAGRTEGTSTLYLANSNIGSFVSSDESALARHSQDVYSLDDFSCAALRPDGFRVMGRDGQYLDPQMSRIDVTRIESGDRDVDGALRYEIFEQPIVLARQLDSDVVKAFADEISRARLVYLLGMGTAEHAADVGARLIRQYFKVPAFPFLATDLDTYLIDKDSVIIPISQSGSTADTYMAAEKAKESGARVLSILNVELSPIAKVSDVVLGVKAGREIAVISTKAYTAQLRALAEIASHGPYANGLSEALIELPAIVSSTLRLSDEKTRLLAKEMLERGITGLYVLGTGYNLPTAMEGALKIKEAAYIHAEGIESYQQKHGALTLVGPQHPSIFIAPSPVDSVLESEMIGTRSKGGVVYAIVDHNSKYEADGLLKIDKIHSALTPITCTIPLQLLAYHLGVEQGIPVSTPRYLAKSVTVK